jgi:para-aminobenzoate synthetase component 1
MSGLPLVEQLATVPDPADAAECFADLPYLLLLDSTADDHRTGRFSFLSADPSAIVRSRGGAAERRDGPGTRWTPIASDALAEARAWLTPFHCESKPGLPPFQGGAAGYIGYDWGATLERLPSARYDDLHLSDVVLGLYDWVIAWDHCEHSAWIVSTGIPATDTHRVTRARARSSMVHERLAAGPRAGRAVTEATAGVQPAPSYPVIGVEGAEDIGLRSTFTHRGYLTAVSRVREYILAGDIFQANISQRFQAPLDEAPITLYHRLRQSNPSAFGAYLDFGDVQVLSVSPERFLKVSGRTVETRPIKGTRPRGLGPMHDALLGQVLAESDKDRAENVMIVDLLRNDLSRVCRPGTVRVPELFALEQHPTVHHLVSTVVGELEARLDVVDLLQATFPGGSITGAPKVRAMEIIAELEPTRRGIYCGSLGYLSITGDMDTSIAIRTAVVRNGKVYFQAGGGIVADSDPEAEYRETLDKARGIIRALTSAHQRPTGSR